MSLHAGLDMASPERERELLLLLICGSSGLLLPSAERELTRDFYKLEIRSAASSPPRRRIRRRASRSSSPSGVYFYHSVPFITLDSWNCACCSLATAALCGGSSVWSHFEGAVSSSAGTVDVLGSDETIFRDLFICLRFPFF